MGFLLGSKEYSVPKFIIYALTLLGFIHNLISSILSFMSLKHLVIKSESSSFQELHPVVDFSELVDPPDRCVVCLEEFEARDEIRLLSNCRHVFHRCCIDRWMGYNWKTCPLCSTPFVPEDLQDSFNERLSVASGVADGSPVGST